MTRKQPVFLRAVAAFLCLLMATEELSFAAPEISRAITAVSLLALPIPSSIATVEESWVSPDPSARIVYLVKDAHSNPSAQRNIAAALETLVEKRGVRHVLLEGGWGDDSLADLRALAPADERRRVAENFFSKGWIQGPDRFDLTSDAEFRMQGVEDPQLYAANLRAYRSVKRSRESALTYLATLRGSLRAQKGKLFGPALAEADEERDAHATGRLPAGEYLYRLSKKAGFGGSAPESYPHLRRLGRLRSMEEHIDFTAAQDERVSAMSSLRAEKKGESLAAAAALASLPENLSTREAFTASLLGAVGPRRYPELRKYARYLREAKRLDASAAVEERARFEEECFDRLAPAGDAARLLRYDRALERLDRLFRLELTPSEYRRISSDPIRHDVTEIGGFLNRRIMETATGFEGTVFADAGYEAAFRGAMEFYRLTEERDAAFVRNAMDTMSEEGASSAALVAGGFHTDNLRELFRRNGVSYAVVTPAVASVTDRARYESLLLGQEADTSSSAEPPSALAPQPGAQLTVLVEGSRLSVKQLLETELREAGTRAWKPAERYGEGIFERASSASRLADTSRPKGLNPLLYSLEVSALASVIETRILLDHFTRGFTRLKYETPLLRRTLAAVDLLVPMNPIPAKRRALDIGTGASPLPFFLMLLGWQSRAVDVNELYLKHKQSHVESLGRTLLAYGGSYEGWHEDASSWRLLTRAKAGSFSLVTLLDTFGGAGYFAGLRVQPAKGSEAWRVVDNALELLDDGGYALVTEAGEGIPVDGVALLRDVAESRRARLTQIGEPIPYSESRAVLFRVERGLRSGSRLATEPPLRLRREMMKYWHAAIGDDRRAYRELLENTDSARLRVIDPILISRSGESTASGIVTQLSHRLVDEGSYPLDRGEMAALEVAVENVMQHVAPGKNGLILVLSEKRHPGPDDPVWIFVLDGGEGMPVWDVLFRGFRRYTTRYGKAIKKLRENPRALFSSKWSIESLGERWDQFSSSFTQVMDPPENGVLFTLLRSTNQEREASLEGSRLAVWENRSSSRSWPAELSLRSFHRAAGVVAPAVKRTPLVKSERLSRLVGKPVYVKNEAWQRGGSFKMRGVYYEVYVAVQEAVEAALGGGEEERRRLASLKIVTQSTGNHGAAMIAAVTAVIRHFAEENPSLEKEIRSIEPRVYSFRALEPVKYGAMEEALKEYGRETDSDGRPFVNKDFASYEEARRAMRKLILENPDTVRYMAHGGVDIMLGHGTAGLEIAEQLEELGIGKEKNVSLWLPVGAGGPIGIAAAFKQARPNSAAVMVQSPRWGAFVRSLITGNPFEKNEPNAPGETVYEDGTAVDGPESPEVVEMARAVFDAAVQADSWRAYNGAAPLLFADLAEGQQLPRVGGISALTAEAVLTFADLEVAKQSDAIVIFATEGNVSEVMTESLRRTADSKRRLRELEAMYELDKEALRYPKSAGIGSLRDPRKGEWRPEALAQELAELQITAFGLRDRNVIEHYWQDAVASKTNDIRVIVENGQIVAAADFDLRGSGYELSHIMVHPDRRRREYATRLMDEFLRLAAEREQTRAFWTSTNRDADLFYEKYIRERGLERLPAHPPQSSYVYFAVRVPGARTAAHPPPPQASRLAETLPEAVRIDRAGNTYETDRLGRLVTIADKTGHVWERYRYETDDPDPPFWVRLENVKENGRPLVLHVRLLEIARGYIEALVYPAAGRGFETEGVPAGRFIYKFSGDSIRIDTMTPNGLSTTDGFPSRINHGVASTAVNWLAGVAARKGLSMENFGTSNVVLLGIYRTYFADTLWRNGTAADLEELIRRHGFYGREVVGDVVILLAEGPRVSVSLRKSENGRDDSYVVISSRNETRLASGSEVVIEKGNVRTPPGSLIGRLHEFNTPDPAGPIEVAGRPRPVFPLRQPDGSRTFHRMPLPVFAGARLAFRMPEMKFDNAYKTELLVRSGPAEAWKRATYLGGAARTRVFAYDDPDGNRVALRVALNPLASPTHASEEVFSRLSEKGISPRVFGAGWTSAEGGLRKVIAVERVDGSDLYRLGREGLSEDQFRLFFDLLDRMIEKRECFTDLAPEQFMIGKSGGKGEEAAWLIDPDDIVEVDSSEEALRRMHTAMKTRQELWKRTDPQNRIQRYFELRFLARALEAADPVAKTSALSGLLLSYGAFIPDDRLERYLEEIRRRPDAASRLASEMPGSRLALFPKLRPGSRHRVVEVVQYLRTKDGLRRVAEGGPIGQPAFTPIRDDETALAGLMDILRVPPSRGFISGYSSDKFEDASAKVSFADFLESKTDPDLPWRFVWKPVLSAFGRRILYVVFHPEAGWRVVTSVFSDEFGYKTIRSFRLAFAEIPQAHFTYSSAGGYAQWSLPAQQVVYTAMLLGIERAWLAFSQEVFSSRGRPLYTRYDAGIAEDAMRLIRPNGGAYETRYTFTGNLATGESIVHLDPVKKPLSGLTYARSGDHPLFFTHGADNTVRKLDATKMLDPLFHRYGIEGKAREEFRDEVVSLVRSEFAYIGRRLREAGIVADATVHGEFDLGWQEVDGRPVPRLIEGSFSVDGENGARTFRIERPRAASRLAYRSLRDLGRRLERELAPQLKLKHSVFGKSWDNSGDRIGIWYFSGDRPLFDIRLIRQMDGSVKLWTEHADGFLYEANRQPGVREVADKWLEGIRAGLEAQGETVIFGPNWKRRHGGRLAEARQVLEEIRAEAALLPGRRFGKNRQIMFDEGPAGKIRIVSDRSDLGLFEPVASLMVPLKNSDALMLRQPLETTDWQATLDVPRALENVMRLFQSLRGRNTLETRQKALDGLQSRIQAEDARIEAFLADHPEARGPFERLAYVTREMGDARRRLIEIHDGGLSEAEAATVEGRVPVSVPLESLDRFLGDALAWPRETGGVLEEYRQWLGGRETVPAEWTDYFMYLLFTSGLEAWQHRTLARYGEDEELADWKRRYPEMSDAVTFNEMRRKLLAHLLEVPEGDALTPFYQVEAEAALSQETVRQAVSDSPAIEAPASRRMAAAGLLFIGPEGALRFVPGAGANEFPHASDFLFNERYLALWHHRGEAVAAVTAAYPGALDRIQLRKLIKTLFNHWLLLEPDEPCYLGFVDPGSGVLTLLRPKTNDRPRVEWFEDTLTALIDRENETAPARKALQAARQSADAALLQKGVVFPDFWSKLLDAAGQTEREAVEERFAAEGERVQKGLADFLKSYASMSVGEEKRRSMEIITARMRLSKQVADLVDELSLFLESRNAERFLADRFEPVFIDGLTGRTTEEDRARDEELMRHEVSRKRLIGLATDLLSDFSTVTAALENAAAESRLRKDLFPQWKRRPEAEAELLPFAELVVDGADPAGTGLYELVEGISDGDWERLRDETVHAVRATRRYRHEREFLDLTMMFSEVFQALPEVLSRQGVRPSDADLRGRLAAYLHTRVSRVPDSEETGSGARLAASKEAITRAADSGRPAVIQYHPDALALLPSATIEKIERIASTPFSSLRAGADYDRVMRSGIRSEQSSRFVRALAVDLPFTIGVRARVFDSLKVKGVIFDPGRQEEMYHPRAHSDEIGMPQSQPTPELSTPLHQPTFDERGRFRLERMSPTPLGAMLLKDAVREFENARAAFETGQNVPFPVAFVEFPGETNPDGSPLGAVILGVPKDTEMRAQDLMNRWAKAAIDDETLLFMDWAWNTSQIVRIGQGAGLRVLNAAGFAHTNLHLGNAAVTGTGDLFYHDVEGMQQAAQSTWPQFFGYTALAFRNALLSAEYLQTNLGYRMLASAVSLDWRVEFLKGYLDDDPDFEDKLPERFFAHLATPLHTLFIPFDSQPMHVKPHPIIRAIKDAFLRDHPEAVRALGARLAEAPDFSVKERFRMWDSLSGTDVVYDTLVVGGGITGAHVARESAIRGLAVALFEKGDFAGETSSRSTKLIHAGFRYLETAWRTAQRKDWPEARRNLRLVWFASRERANLERMAPDLVRRLSIYIPSYRGDRNGLGEIALGVAVYTLFAMRWLHPIFDFGAASVLRRFRYLRQEGLRGGFLHFDAMTDDARLVRRVIRDAYSRGAKTLNFTEVVSIRRVTEPGAKARFEATVTNRLTGETTVVRARSIVNATGPFLDALRGIGDFSGLKEDRSLLSQVRGTHIDVRSPELIQQFDQAFLLMDGETGRVFFVIPRKDAAGRPYLRIGTTERKHEDPSGVYPTAGEVAEIVGAFQRAFPYLTLRPEHVIAADAGVRPLYQNPAAPGQAMGQISREHEILLEPHGVVHAAGVKLTDGRRAGQEVVDKLMRHLGKRDSGSSASREPLLRAAGDTVSASDLALWIEHLFRYEMLMSFPSLMFLYGGELAFGSDPERVLEALSKLGSLAGWDHPEKLRQMGLYKGERRRRLSAVEEWAGQGQSSAAEEGARLAAEKIDRRKFLLAGLLLSPAAAVLWYGRPRQVTPVASEESTGTPTPETTEKDAPAEPKRAEVVTVKIGHAWYRVARVSADPVSLKPYFAGRAGASRSVEELLKGRGQFAVNGGYHWKGFDIGLVKRNGRVERLGSYGRRMTVFGVGPDGAGIDTPRSEPREFLIVTKTAHGRSLEKRFLIQQVNGDATSRHAGITHYTPSWGPRTGNAKSEGLLEITVDADGKASYRRANSPIPPGGFVLAVSGLPGVRKFLTDRADYRFRFEMNWNGIDGDFVHAMAAGPRLVSEGKNVARVYTRFEEVPADIRRRDAARSMVGVTKSGNKVIFAQTDDLISLHDAAQAMIWLGAWEAMNLDGGGSAQFHKPGWSHPASNRRVPNVWIGGEPSGSRLAATAANPALGGAGTYESLRRLVESVFPWDETREEGVISEVTLRNERVEQTLPTWVGAASVIAGNFLFLPAAASSSAAGLVHETDREKVLFAQLGQWALRGYASFGRGQTKRGPIQTHQAILLLQAFPEAVKGRTVVVADLGTDGLLAALVSRLGAEKVYLVPAHAVFSAERAQEYLRLNRIENVQVLDTPLEKLDAAQVPGVSTVIANLPDGGINLDLQPPFVHPEAARRLKPEWYFLVGGEGERQAHYDYAGMARDSVEEHGYETEVEWRFSGYMRRIPVSYVLRLAQKTARRAGKKPTGTILDDETMAMNVDRLFVAHRALKHPDMAALLNGEFPPSEDRDSVTPTLVYHHRNSLGILDKEAQGTRQRTTTLFRHPEAGASVRAFADAHPAVKHGHLAGLLNALHFSAVRSASVQPLEPASVSNYRNARKSLNPSQLGTTTGPAEVAALSDALDDARKDWPATLELFAEARRWTGEEKGTWGRPAPGLEAPAIVREGNNYGIAYSWNAQRAEIRREFDSEPVRRAVPVGNLEFFLPFDATKTRPGADLNADTDEDTASDVPNDVPTDVWNALRPVERKVSRPSRRHMTSAELTETVFPGKHENRAKYASATLRLARRTAETAIREGRTGVARLAADTGLPESGVLSFLQASLTEERRLVIEMDYGIGRRRVEPDDAVAERLSDFMARPYNRGRIVDIRRKSLAALRRWTEARPIVSVPAVMPPDKPKPKRIAVPAAGESKDREEANRRYFEAWKSADPGTKETLKGLLLLNNRSYVESVARKFWDRKRPGGVEFGDVVQEGMLGLSMAIDQFKPEKGVPFLGFAKVVIERQILNGLRRGYGLVYIPPAMVRFAYDVRKELEKATGPDASFDEWVEALAAAEPDIDWASVLQQTDSFDRPLSVDADSGTLGDVVPGDVGADPALRAEESDFAARIYDAAEALSPLEGRVFRTMFFEEPNGNGGSPRLRPSPLSVPEVSDKTGERLKRVENAWARARDRMTQLIEGSRLAGNVARWRVASAEILETLASRPELRSRVVGVGRAKGRTLESLAREARQGSVFVRALEKGGRPGGAIVLKIWENGRRPTPTEVRVFAGWARQETIRLKQSDYPETIAAVRRLNNLWKRHLRNASFSNGHRPEVVSVLEARLIAPDGTPAAKSREVVALLNALNVPESGWRAIVRLYETLGLPRVAASIESTRKYRVYEAKSKISDPKERAALQRLALEIWAAGKEELARPFPVELSENFTKLLRAVETDGGVELHVILEDGEEATLLGPIANPEDTLREMRAPRPETAGTEEPTPQFVRGSIRAAELAAEAALAGAPAAGMPHGFLIPVSTLSGEATPEAFRAALDLLSEEMITYRASAARSQSPVQYAFTGVDSLDPAQRQEFDEWLAALPEYCLRQAPPNDDSGIWLNFLDAKAPGKPSVSTRRIYLAVQGIETGRGEVAAWGRYFRYGTALLDHFSTGQGNQLSRQSLRENLLNYYKSNSINNLEDAETILDLLFGLAEERLYAQSALELKVLTADLEVLVRAARMARRAVEYSA